MAGRSGRNASGCARSSSSPRLLYRRSSHDPCQNLSRAFPRRSRIRSRQDDLGRRAGAPSQQPRAAGAGLQDRTGFPGPHDPRPRRRDAGRVSRPLDGWRDRLAAQALRGRRRGRSHPARRGDGALRGYAVRGRSRADLRRSGGGADRCPRHGPDRRRTRARNGPLSAAPSVRRRRRQPGRRRASCVWPSRPTTHRCRSTWTSRWSSSAASSASPRQAGPRSPRSNARRAAFAAEHAEYERKLAEREARRERTGRKPGGKPPKAPEPGPRAKDQVSLTDAESRIMPTAGGFEQAYNAQANVDTETHLIVATHVTDHPNDKQEIGPALERLDALPEALGAVDALLGRHRLSQPREPRALRGRRHRSLHPRARQGHNPPLAERLADDPPALQGQPTPAEATAHRLRTRAARPARPSARPRSRPSSASSSTCRARRFLLRGLRAVQGEWALVCLGWNLKRLFALRKMKKSARSSAFAKNTDNFDLSRALACLIVSNAACRNPIRNLGS